MSIVAMDTFGRSRTARRTSRRCQRRRGRGRAGCSPASTVGNRHPKGIAIATAVLAATALFGSLPRCDPTNRRAGRRRPAGPGVGTPRSTSASTCQPAQPGRAVDRRLGRVPEPGWRSTPSPRRQARSVFRCQQFKEHPGIMGWRGSRSTARVVDIYATRCVNSVPRVCWPS